MRPRARRFAAATGIGVALVAILAILLNKGPHPEAERDFELFCEVVTPALGL